MATLFAPVPPAVVSRVLATFDRGQLEGFIAIAIDLLDLADAASDPDAPIFDPRSHDGGAGDLDDAEDDGDAEDHDAAEDDFIPQLSGGAGCPLADPGGLDPGDNEHDLRPVADLDLARAHRDRIRRTACRQTDSHRTIERHGYRFVSMDVLPFELLRDNHTKLASNALATIKRRRRASGAEA